MSAIQCPWYPTAVGTACVRCAPTPSRGYRQAGRGGLEGLRCLCWHKTLWDLVGDLLSCHSVACWILPQDWWVKTWPGECHIRLTSMLMRWLHNGQLTLSTAQSSMQPLQKVCLEGITGVMSASRLRHMGHIFSSWVSAGHTCACSCSCHVDSFAACLPASTQGLPLRQFHKHWKINDLLKFDITDLGLLLINTLTTTALVYDISASKINAILDIAHLEVKGQCLPRDGFPVLVGGKMSTAYPYFSVSGWCTDLGFHIFVHCFLMLHPSSPPAIRYFEILAKWGVQRVWSHIILSASKQRERVFQDARTSLVV